MRLQREHVGTNLGNTWDLFKFQLRKLIIIKLRLRTAWLSMGRYWTVKGHWAKKRIIFGCKVLGAAVAAAETCAWHDSEMQEINSVLCRYMRVKSAAPHEHWRILAVLVEVAVRRVGWL